MQASLLIKWNAKSQPTGQLRCAFCSTISSAPVEFQDSPQLNANRIGQLLGMCKGIGIRFVELRTPQLSSILRINQFHMQKQLIFAPNHFSYDDRTDKQILTNDSYIKAFVLAVPNGAGCQNPYFWCLRNRI